MSDRAEVESLLAALVKLDEPQRYRALGALLAELAEQAQTTTGLRAASAEQFEALTRRFQQLEQENANRLDQLKTVQADLEHRVKQLQAEQARGQELQQVVEEQRKRLVALQKELHEAQTQLTARASELHEAQTERDTVLVKLQRTSADKGDRATMEALEEARRQLAQQVTQLQAQIEQVRSDKNAEIEALQKQLQGAAAKPVRTEENILAKPWQRLAVENPPLAPRNVLPTPTAADRLVEAFIELFHFVQGLDEDVRPLLTKYTKWDQSVRVPWSIYTSQPSLLETVQQTISPPSGKPVVVLRQRLKSCRQWMFAALWSSDITIESVPAELRSHLMGPRGSGADPKCTVRDYLRQDGAEDFVNALCKLRTTTLAEVCARGGIMR